MVLDAWVIVGLQKFEEKVDGYHLSWLSCLWILWYSISNFFDLSFRIFQEPSNISVRFGSNFFFLIIVDMKLCC